MRRGSAIAGVVSLGLLTTLFAFTIGNETWAIRRTESGTQVADFSYYLAATRAVLQGTSASIYSAETHTAALATLVGHPVTSSNPLALLPPFVLALLPFALISFYSTTLASSAFLAISCLAFLTGAARVVGLSAARWRPWYWLLLISSVSSLCFVIGLSIHQVTLLAVGVLLHLIAALRTREISRTDVVLPIAALVLGLKPAYLLCGVAVLIAEGTLRAVGYLGVWFFAACAIATIFLGADWPEAYLAGLRAYSSVHPPAIYAAVFNFETAPLLRSLTSWSNPAAVIAGGTLGGAALILCMLLTGARFAKPLALPLATLGVYFATTPYIGEYDYLLIVPAILHCFICAERLTQLPIKTAPLAILLSAVVLSGELVGVPHQVRWGALALLAVLGGSCRSRAFDLIN